ncbi:uncharacterized protein LOC120629887 [Pararge aegeria]|nr:uncharacterized protein LOC120629887 [Pararge aegeria]
MRVLIVTASFWVLVAAKPEMYKEKEDFQYSRSSSDDGTKSGYYGAQRGNMGGNYERAHNMDSLAQHHMSTLVRNVDGELGEGANTRSGSVFSAANSRGLYGSGNYDLGYLKGRNFGEGMSFRDSSAHTPTANSGRSGYSSYGDLYSAAAANNARYSSSQSQNAGVSSGYQKSGLASQYVHTDAQQAADNIYDASNYEHDSQAGSNYKYAQSTNVAQSDYEKSNSAGYDYKTRGSLITPVRIYSIRPGSRVAIPVVAQVYDASAVQDQNAINSDSDILSTSGQRLRYVPTNNAKHYESSYSYRKQWEKKDSIPAVTEIPTESPFSKNSELYEDAQISQTSNNQYESDLASADSQSSSANGAYSSGYSGNTRTALSSQARLQSQTYNSGASSSDAYTQNAYNSGVSASNAYNHNTYDAGVAEKLFGSHLSESTANSNNLVENIASKPKSYHSSYAYHKSWERRGDPYVIKPVGGDINDQTSQRLTAASANQGYGCTYCLDQSQLRKRRSLNTDEYQQRENLYDGQKDIGQQQSMSGWEQELGQQTDKWQNFEDLGQQTQNKWDDLESLNQKPQSQLGKLEDLDQQTQNQWDKVEDLGQQTQNQWGKLEDLGQQPQTQDKLEDLGQQTQSHWGKLEDLGQQIQSQWGQSEDLSQQSQNQWNKLDDLSQQPQTQDKLEDLGQQTQSHWGKLEDLGQQIQSQWGQSEDLGQQSQSQWNKLDDLSQQPQTQDKLEDLGQQTQSQWSKLEDLSQQTQTQDQLENLGQQTQNQWGQLEDLGQQSQSQWNKLDDLSQQPQTQANPEDLGQQIQNQWGQLEQLGQQSPRQWYKLHDLSQRPQNEDKLEDLSQQTQSHWSKLENLGQSTGGYLVNVGQQTQNKWNKLNDVDPQENLGQQGQPQNVVNIGQETQFTQNTYGEYPFYNPWTMDGRFVTYNDNRNIPELPYAQESQENINRKNCHNFEDGNYFHHHNFGFKESQAATHSSDFLFNINQIVYPEENPAPNQNHELLPKSDTNILRETTTIVSVTTDDKKPGSSNKDEAKENNSSNVITHPIDIGRGDIGPEDTSIEITNIDSKNSYKTPEEIESLSLVKDQRNVFVEPLILSVTGLNQHSEPDNKHKLFKELSTVIESVTTSTTKPKQIIENNDMNVTPKSSFSNNPVFNRRQKEPNRILASDEQHHEKPIEILQNFEQQNWGQETQNVVQQNMGQHLEPFQEQNMAQDLEPLDQNFLEQNFEPFEEQKMRQHLGNFEEKDMVQHSEPLGRQNMESLEPLAEELSVVPHLNNFEQQNWGQQAQSLDQQNMEHLDRFEQENLGQNLIPFSKQNMEELESIDKNTRPLDISEKQTVEQLDLHDKFGKQFKLPTDENIVQNSQDSSKHAQEQINNLSKNRDLSTPIEPTTENPGFWGSVWNKTKRAKASVVSWFKS